SIGDGVQNVCWEVLGGELTVREMVFAPPLGTEVEGVKVEVGSQAVAATFTQEASRITVTLPRAIQATVKRDLSICIRHGQLT
ncbi:MAG: hypothetical protein OXJ55_04175, partial [Caldilineaceae bacterium]|nr:hypothetical protein [Caldilineaceae bacterium]